MSLLGAFTLQSFKLITFQLNISIWSLTLPFFIFISAICHDCQTNTLTTAFKTQAVIMQTIDKKQAITQFYNQICAKFNILIWLPPSHLNDIIIFKLRRNMACLWFLVNTVSSTAVYDIKLSKFIMKLTHYPFP